MFGSFLEGGEAKTLQNEYYKIEPRLTGIYESSYFRPYMDVYLALTRDFNRKKDNMTEKGKKEVLYGYLIEGRKSIDHDLSRGCAFILFAVFHRSEMLNNETAANTVAKIRHQQYLMFLCRDAINSYSGYFDIN